MIAFIAGLALIIGLVILALCERKRAASYDYTQLPDATWSAREYLGDGHWRDWYAPFDGRDLDQYERNHYEQAMLSRATDLLGYRQTGRMQGRHVTVTWHPGRDHQADILADWIQQYGEQCGVHVRQA